MKRYISTILVLVLMLSGILTFGQRTAASDSVSVTVPVQISLSGTEPNIPEVYSIKMTRVNQSAPMPEGTTEDTCTITVRGADSAKFPAISYEELGNYTYKISQISGNSVGCTYDSTVYTLYVRTVYSERGVLTPIVIMYVSDPSDKVDAASFTNHYEASARVEEAPTQAAQPSLSVYPEPSVSPEASLTPEPTEDPYVTEEPEPTGEADASVTPDPDVSVTPTSPEKGGTVKVTKSLQDFDGRALFAEEVTYYVALYSDEARTQRVSEVQPVTIHNSTTASVTFEGLEPGKTYYIGETTADGELLTAQASGATVFTPDYGSSVGVKLTLSAMDGNFAFENTYYELPENFYYAGHITVTKKTLLGTDDYYTNQTFYAAVFEDPDYTKRVGDVAALDMNGASSATVHIDVPIGESLESTITYYVTETDADGNPIENSDALDYTMTVDNSEVSLSLADTSGDVTITNRFDPAKVTTTPAASGTSDSAADSTGSGTNAVRTADDTPITQTVLLLVLSGMSAALLIAQKKRRL